MTAKEAIQQELGDLFATLPAQTAIVQDEVSDDSDVQDEVETVGEEDEGFLDNAFQFEDAEGSDDTAPDDSANDVSDDASDDGLDELLAQIDNADNDDAGVPVDGSADTQGIEQQAQLSPEETTACIEAANEAMDNTKMSPEMLDWGLDYLTKMYKQQNEQLRARLAQSDRNAARARYKAQADEEEAQERAEKEQYLRG